MKPRRETRKVEDIERDGREEKRLVDEDPAGHLRSDEILIHRHQTSLNTYLGSEESLFIPQFPKARAIGVIDQVDFVQIPDEGVRERLFTVQPKTSDVETSAFVTCQLS